MSRALEDSAKKAAGIPAFFRRQFSLHPPALPAGTDLTGRIAIITGGNAGLGLEASRQFLRLRPSQLIITVRSQSKGDAAVSTLRREFPDAPVSAWLLDMESYESVMAFAERCKTLPRIDIVILNAGTQRNIFKLHERTQHEMTIQVNYLSTALLTILLIPVMASKREPGTRPPLLSVVSSDTAYWAKIKTDGPILPQFDVPEDFSNAYYSKSKLLLLWFVEKLSEIVKSDSVIINSSNPGLTSGTNLNDELFSTINPMLKAFVNTMKNFLGRSIADGASNYVYATVVQGEESHGSFVSDWSIQP
jgi:NAD(P)-dependent dehydrogenase (short-subunit alcohol dehydrogenase family)